MQIPTGLTQQLRNEMLISKRIMKRERKEVEKKGSRMIVWGENCLFKTISANLNRIPE